MKNEFIEILEEKDDMIGVYALDEKAIPVSKILFTKIEFDNLIHLILDNKKVLLNKYCFEKSHKEKKNDNI